MVQRCLNAAGVALALFLTFSLVQPASAQTIRGELLDATSDDPVASGTVALLNASGEVITEARSRPSGEFLIEVPADSTAEYLLSAQALGYHNATDGPFRLGPADSITVQFRIPRKPVVMDSMVVEARSAGIGNYPDLIRNGFADRMRTGLGKFLTPRDLDRIPAQDLGNFFERVQGVVVNYSFGGDRILMRSGTGRRCIPDIYLDGFRQAVQGGLKDLGLHPREVKAIEVYRRPAEAPPEYGGGDQANCGIVLIWSGTRR